MQVAAVLSRAHIFGNAANNYFEPKLLGIFCVYIPPPVDQLLHRAREAGIIDVNTSALGGTADGSSDGDEMCTAMDAELVQLARIVRTVCKWISVC